MRSYGAICGWRCGERARGLNVPFLLLRSQSNSITEVRLEGCCLQEQVPPLAFPAKHSQDVGTALPDSRQTENTKQAPRRQAELLMGYTNNRLWGL